MMRKLSSVDIVKAFFSFVLLLSIGIQRVEASISPVTSFTLRDWGINGTVDERTIYPSYSGFWGCITNAKTSTPQPWIDETFFEFDMRGLSVQPKMFLETPLRTMSIWPTPSPTADVKIAYYSGSGVPDNSRLGKGTFFATVAVSSKAGDIYYIDVTDIYNNFITSGKSYLGFRFYQPVWTGTSNGTQVFTDYPAVLTPTPEPATLFLLTLGGLLLRRKK